MKTVFLILTFVHTVAFAARIKDIATLKGARNNQLFGYGIIIGLPGTGDKANELTENSLHLVLKSLGADIKKNMETKNVASVVVTSTLPPYAKIGSKLDMQVSSVGSAQSLDGGTLLMTSLRGADGKVYAMGSGKVLAMKKTAGGGGGGGGSSAQNMVTGLIPGGAMLERELPQNFAEMKELKYQLLSPDFTTAVRIAHRVNEELGGQYATAHDPVTVEVLPPYQFEGSIVELIAQIESIEVEADVRAKVVINAKTGTVVLGDQVRISPVAIAHGNLKIEVRDEPRTPQSTTPGAPATPPADAKEGAPPKDQKLMVMKRGTSIAEIASSLNDMGASSEDLIALLQALKASGALMAELEMQ